MNDNTDFTLDPGWDPGCPACRDATSGATALAMLPEGRSWTLAPALAALRDEVNRLWPSRDRSYDGTIGDLAHQAQSKSEHNPDVKGVVRAIDITARGIDVDALLNAAIGDPRVHYVIYRGRICSRTYGWTWHRSSGHEHHVHISLRNHTSESAPWDVIDRAAENVSRWFKSKGEADMPLNQEDFNGIARTVDRNVLGASAGSYGTFFEMERATADNVRKLLGRTEAVRRGAPEGDVAMIQEIADAKSLGRANSAQLAELSGKVDRILEMLEAQRG
jgi:hypothetical protein